MDIGCGTGNITNMINDYVKSDQVIGIDKSEGMIEFAKNNYYATGLDFEVWDICDKPHPDSKFKGNYDVIS